MKTIASSFCLLALLSCSKPAEVKEVSLIPQPQSIIVGTGSFSLNEKTVIVAQGEAIPSAEFLQDFLKRGTGMDLSIVSKRKKNAIILSLDQSGMESETSKEGYILKSTGKNVVISSTTSAGFFYGVQTLRQLFPAEIENPVIQEGVDWSIPVVEIKEQHIL